MNVQIYTHTIYIFKFIYRERDRACCSEESTEIDASIVL